MNYSEVEYIEVPHQLPARRWSTNDIVSAAFEEGWDYEKFDNMEQVIECFGDCENDVPEDWKKALAEITFPAIHETSDGGSWDNWYKAEDFNAEERAFAFLASDLNCLIKIENDADARYYAEKYNGHQRAKVHSLAKQILEDYAE